MIQEGCLELQPTLELCALDLEVYFFEFYKINCFFSYCKSILIKLTEDTNVIDMHLSTYVDLTLQNILNGNSPGSCVEMIADLCPKNCSGNGVCEMGNVIFRFLNKGVFLIFNIIKKDENCLPPVGGSIREISEECLYPSKMI